MRKFKKHKAELLLKVPGPTLDTCNRWGKFAGHFECPVYDHRTHVLYWSDIWIGSVYGVSLLDWAPGQPVSIGFWQFEGTTGGMCLASRRGKPCLLVAQGRDIIEWDPETNRRTTFVSNLGRDGTRLNEAFVWRVNGKSRLYWAGMDLECKRPIGDVHLIQPNGSHQVVIEGVKVGNGMAASPKGLDAIDSPVPVIKRRPFNADGTLGDAVDWFSLDNASRKYHPAVSDLNWCGLDGLAASESFLFPGMFNGQSQDGDGGVIPIISKATADVVGEIEVPGPIVTSCCFGGPERNTLFATASNEIFDRDNLRAHQEANDPEDPYLGLWGASAAIYYCVLPNQRGITQQVFKIA